MTDDRALIAILTDQAKDLTSLLSRAPMTTQVISRIDIDDDTVLDTEFNDADESTYNTGELPLESPLDAPGRDHNGRITVIGAVPATFINTPELVHNQFFNTGSPVRSTTKVVGIADYINVEHQDILVEYSTMVGDNLVQVDVTAETTYADGEGHSLRTGITLDVGEIITRERAADEDALYDWLADHLLPLTGTDRTGTDALYEAKVTAVSDDRFDYLIGRSIEAEG